ncbi:MULTISPECIES: amidohydrolase family protein [unclassified Streptomyces]|uniref:amidohydrolase family protein n=1 Tax=unclassified Streptomyces TaxID=2593676 RepID=UPI003317281E
MGDDADVAAVTGSQTRLVNAAGGMVMPGLIDVHSHVGFGGQAAAWELGLSPVFGVEEILGAVRDRAGTLGPDEWVVGGIVISPVFQALGNREIAGGVGRGESGQAGDAARRLAAQPVGEFPRPGHPRHRLVIAGSGERELRP